MPVSVIPFNMPEPAEIPPHIIESLKAMLPDEAVAKGMELLLQIEAADTIVYERVGAEGGAELKRVTGAGEDVLRTILEQDTQCSFAMQEGAGERRRTKPPASRGGEIPAGGGRKRNARFQLCPASQWRRRSIIRRAHLDPSCGEWAAQPRTAEYLRGVARRTEPDPGGLGALRQYPLSAGRLLRSSRALPLHFRSARTRLLRRRHRPASGR